MPSGQVEFALQHHDAVVHATTDFHTRILSRLVIGIKSTLRFVEINPR